jgi:elongation factor Ts
MAITPAQVAELRARTGAGILDAKNALEEAKGDTDKAIEILRKKGQAQAVKKADRTQNEGGVFIAASDKKAGVVFVKCETDFVARSEPFLKLGQELAKTLHDKGQAGFDAFAKEKVPAAVLELGENVSVGSNKLVEAAVVGTYVHSNRKIGVVVGLDGGTVQQATDASMHAAAMNPTYVKPEEVDAAAVAQEREIWKEQLAKEKKPAEIIEKIMLGKEKKFREENALLTQPFVKDQNQTVGKMLGKANVTAYVRVAV